jgi:hypothetical protein
MQNVWLGSDTGVMSREAHGSSFLWGGQMAEGFTNI